MANNLSPEERCEKRVSSDSWHQSRCSRKAVTVEDGKRYCRQHTPSLVAAKEVEKTKLYNQKWDRKREEYHRGDVLKRISEGITTVELEKLSPKLLKGLLARIQGERPRQGA